MKRQRAFTIVELLVVVSIIALLVGILLPAIGKARERAQLSKSEANMRNLMSACHNYAADWNDRQFSLTPDNITKYGNSPAAARGAWIAAHGGDIFTYPLMELGITPPNFVWFAGSTGLVSPMNFDGDNAGWGWFRFPNCGQFNEYLTGRFYDPIFYPPKDKAAWSVLEGCMQNAGEIADCETGGIFTSGTERYYPAGYCFSPAALMSPDVLGRTNDSPSQWGEGPGALRCPSMSQARYPELKTHMIEHHGLQFSDRVCNPGFADGIWHGCEPYYFNHYYKSTPVTLFYDGHIQGLGQYEAIQGDALVEGQTDDDENGGLWHRNAMGANGYFGGAGFDWTNTSHHILTIDGIQGRDKVSRGS